MSEKKAVNTNHDSLCRGVNDNYYGHCDCDLIVEARYDERRRTLDDVEALVRSYFRQHGWQANANQIVEWLDRIVEP